MKLDVVIAAHPDRKEMALELEHKLGADMVVWDRGNGPRDTHERAWQELAGVVGRTAQDWGMVVEDDALPCYRFRACMQASLEVAPTPVVSAYLGRGRPPLWQHSIAKVMNAHADWLVTGEVLHGVGVAVRGDHLHQMVEFLCPIRKGLRFKTIAKRWPEPMDEAMSRWARAFEVPVAYQHPSLLDHDPELPSIIGPDRPRTHTVEVPVALLGKFNEADLNYRKAWWCEAKDHWDNTIMPIPRP